MKDPYNDRQMRLECAKMAALYVTQNKLKKENITDIARMMWKFITEDEDDNRG